jgi:hypothetical protein
LAKSKREPSDRDEPNLELVRHLHDRVPQLITEIGATVRLGFKCLVALGIGYFGFRALEVLAGKQTGASFILAILGDKKVACSIAYGLGGGGMFYGWRQNRHREHVIKRFAPFVERAERDADPDRDSSGLDDRGRTPKEDDL